MSLAVYALKIEKFSTCVQFASKTLPKTTPPPPDGGGGVIDRMFLLVAARLPLPSSNDGRNCDTCQQ
jgi:hypothetical protein